MSSSWQNPRSGMQPASSAGAGGAAASPSSGDLWFAVPTTCQHVHSRAEALQLQVAHPVDAYSQGLALKPSVLQDGCTSMTNAGM